MKGGTKILHLVHVDLSEGAQRSQSQRWHVQVCWIAHGDQSLASGRC